MGRDLGRDRDYSEEVAATIDSEVRSIIEDSYVRAKEILAEHKDRLESVTEALLEIETLNKEQFEAIMSGQEIDLETAKAGSETPVAAYNEEENRVIKTKTEPVVGLE